MRLHTVITITLMISLALSAVMLVEETKTKGLSNGNGGDAVDWTNHITVEKNGEVIAEITNNLTNQGRDKIAAALFDESAIGLSDPGNFDYIGLGNSTDTSNSDSKLADEFSHCNLTVSSADETNWDSGTDTATIKKNFVVDNGGSCTPPITVEETGLYVDDTDSLISYGTFQTATLTDDDELEVTHEITISD